MTQRPLFPKTIALAVLMAASGLSNLFAQNSLPPVSVSEVEPPQATEIKVPRVETIQLTPEMLLPEEQNPAPAYVILPAENRSAVSRLTRWLTFGWIWDFWDWVQTRSAGPQSDKEKKLRDEWETRLGRDYFNYYYKYKEIQNKIEDKTTFDVRDYKAKAKYKFQSQEFELNFKKKF